MICRSSSGTARSASPPRPARLQRDGAAPRRVVFIDAQTGAEVWSYDNLQTAKNREVHNLNHGTWLRARSPESRVAPPPATTTWTSTTGSRLDLRLLQTLYGRDSFDNAGAKLISSVHYSNNYVQRVLGRHPDGLRRR